MPQQFSNSTVRYVPTEAEQEEAVRLVMYAEHNANFAAEILVCAAAERLPEARSAVDYLLLSTDAWQDGRYEQSLRMAYAGIFLTPKNPRILACLELRLGTLFADLANEERALELAEGQILEAQNIDKTFSLPLIFEGDVLFDNEDFDEAEALYQRAAQLNPDDPLSLSSLGYLYLEQDRLTDAEQAFRKAQQLQPTLPIVHLHMATLLQRQKKWEEAVRELQAAIEHQPENPHHYRVLADLFVDMGRRDEADRYYEKALSLNEKA